MVHPPVCASVKLYIESSYKGGTLWNTHSCWKWSPLGIYPLVPCSLSTLALDPLPASLDLWLDSPQSVLRCIHLEFNVWLPSMARVLPGMAFRFGLFLDMPPCCVMWAALRIPSTNGSPALACLVARVTGVWSFLGWSF